MILKSKNNNTKLIKGLKKLPLLGVLSLSMAMSLSSCEDVYDNRDNCVSGVKLQFVFDYHMEPGANSFPANVDCITVYVFDKEGNYIDQFTERGDVLRADDYRMILPLEDGEYRLLVYGGLSCEHSTFNISPEWTATRAHADEITVALFADENGKSSVKLHDLEERKGGFFYGYAVDSNNSAAIGDPLSITVNINEDDYGTDYTEHKIYMMKNTNNIQVILQELTAPTEVDYNDYTFEIIDDNFVLGSDNSFIPQKDRLTTGYSPFAMENRITGYVEPVYRDGAQVTQDMDHQVQVACAEFSTSRLFVDHFTSARLVVTSNKEKDKYGNPKQIIDIPLLEYLALTRGFGYNWIKSDQEYLDRQSNWTLMFFLRSGVWVNACISVNNWIVRINDIELGN